MIHKVAFTMYPVADGVEFKTDVIPGPSCRMAVCLDSEGNSLLLHQKHAPQED